MRKPRLTTLVALLALVGLLILPIRLTAAGTTVYLGLIMGGDPASATPTNTPTAINTATSTPTNTATPTDTATPTNTPTATSTATSTPTPRPPANITVYNTAAFFVQYYVSYNLPGLPLQGLYSGVFNVNQGVTLTIPGGATNVGVLVQHYTGITGWQTTCTRSYVQATSAVIIVSGTTFSPTCTGG
jgi:hypothetical protein